VKGILLATAIAITATLVMAFYTECSATKDLKLAMRPMDLLNRDTKPSTRETMLYG
jgi:predicted membrane-bound mannosyltransferase